MSHPGPLSFSFGKEAEKRDKPPAGTRGNRSTAEVARKEKKKKKILIHHPPTCASIRHGNGTRKGSCSSEREALKRPLLQLRHTLSHWNVARPFLPNSSRLRFRWALKCTWIQPVSFMHKEVGRRKTEGRCLKLLCKLHRRRSFFSAAAKVVSAGGSSFVYWGILTLRVDLKKQWKMERLFFGFDS